MVRHVYYIRLSGRQAGRQAGRQTDRQTDRSKLPYMINREISC